MKVRIAVLIFLSVMAGLYAKAQIKYITEPMLELEIKDSSFREQLDSLLQYSKADFSEDEEPREFIWLVSIMELDSSVIVEGLRDYEVVVVPGYSVGLPDKDIYGFFKVGTTLFVPTIKTKGKNLFNERQLKEVDVPVNYDEEECFPTYFYYFYNDVAYLDGAG